MPLTMRPTGLGSGIDKHLYCGGWDVGRIYETRGGPGSLRWFWSITVNGPNFRSAGQPGRRGRSWRLEALRMCPEPNAEKCQEEPQRLRNRQLALYESRRHRWRGQRISKRLVKDQEARPPARLAHTAPEVCRWGVAGRRVRRFVFSRTMVNTVFQRYIVTRLCRPQWFS